MASLFFADFAGVYDNKLCVAGGAFDSYPVPTLPAHVAVYLVALLDMQGVATSDSFGLGLCVADPEGRTIEVQLPRPQGQGQGQGQGHLGIHGRNGFWISRARFVATRAGLYPFTVDLRLPENMLPEVARTDLEVRVV
jgi:hypothetical protein